jgi:hypothetical protein
LLGDGEAHGEDAIGVVGVDLGGVEAVAEEQLAAETSLGAFGSDDVDTVLALPGALGAPREQVGFVGVFERGRVYSGPPHPGSGGGAGCF